MFMISIPKKDMPLLNAVGCNVTINGEQTVLKRDGEYLCYDDNRCKILEEVLSGNKVQFVAASQGDEDEPHVVLRPDENEVSKDDLLALAHAENKLIDAGHDFDALSERLHGEARAFVGTIAQVIDGLVTAIDDEMRQVD